MGKKKKEPLAPLGHPYQRVARQVLLGSGVSFPDELIPPAVLEVPSGSVCAALGLRADGVPVEGGPVSVDCEMISGVGADNVVDCPKDGSLRESESGVVQVDVIQPGLDCDMLPGARNVDVHY